MGNRILIVDDHARARKALAAELGDAGYTTLEAEDGERAWECFRNDPPDLVITDMVMPRSDGIDLLARIRSRSDVPVIMFTAYGSVSSAVSALKAGADEFVASPDVDLGDLVVLVEKALARYAPADRLRLGDRLVGISPATTRLREQIAGLAPLSTPVLVTGEPGTGRDTVVRALHELGSSAGGELVRISSEDRSPGQLPPMAGAVYLDGVDRLVAEEQEHWAQLLCPPQPGPYPIRPRLFASGSDRLPRLITEGGIHRRLGRELGRFHVRLTPLRERPEDIPEIASTLVARIGAVVGRRHILLSASAVELLATRRWPRNVSQLQQVLERAVAFSRGRAIQRRVIAEVVSEVEESLASIREQSSSAEREALLRAIHETGGNVTQAAEILGRSRAAVYRLISKHGIPLARP